MDELNESFNNFICEFKKLSTKEKRDEIILSIKELIAVFEQLSLAENLDLYYLKNREVNDLKKENVSEDDFLEAELVYLEVAKNIIGQYLEKINNKEV